MVKATEVLWVLRGGLGESHTSWSHSDLSGETIAPLLHGPLYALDKNTLSSLQNKVAIKKLHFKNVYTLPDLNFEAALEGFESLHYCFPDV